MHPKESPRMSFLPEGAGAVHLNWHLQEEEAMAEPAQGTGALTEQSRAAGECTRTGCGWDRPRAKLIRWSRPGSQG